MNARLRVLPTTTLTGRPVVILDRWADDGPVTEISGDDLLVLVFEREIDIVI